MVYPTVFQYQSLINGQFIGGTEGIYQIDNIWEVRTNYTDLLL